MGWILDLDLKKCKHLESEQLSAIRLILKLTIVLQQRYRDTICNNNNNYGNTNQ